MARVGTSRRETRQPDRQPDRDLRLLVPEPSPSPDERTLDALVPAFIENILASPVRVWVKDCAGRFLAVSDGWLAGPGGGRTLTDVLGKSDADIFSDRHAAAALKDEQLIMRTGIPMLDRLERETFHEQPDRWASTSKWPLRNAVGQIIGTWGVSKDVTAEVTAKRDLAEHGMRDALTGLPNRAALMDRLSQALESLKRVSGVVVLLFIDVHDFRDINDTYGHQAGDRVLIEIGRRLRGVTDGTVARFGGDKFVVLCSSHTRYDGEEISSRAEEAFGPAMRESGRLLKLGASIGAAVTRDPAANPGDLLREAEIAMYAGKRAGREQVMVYDPLEHRRTGSSLALAADLERAIREDQLFLLYQPVIDLAAAKLVGVEALVRWKHPQHGVLLPDQFIPVAERHGLIHALDRLVLERAASQLNDWACEHSLAPDLTMAVNFSGSELRDPRIVAAIADALDCHQLEPARLVVEITETAAIDDVEAASDTFAALTRLGVKIALDDFGSGHWSLSHAQRLAAHLLKIDRSFVTRTDRDDRARHVLKAVIAMAHSLGMRVVGEGIETQAQHSRLVELGCDHGQGYLFAPPVRASEIPEFSARLRAVDRNGPEDVSV
jgi:diguanylate cyclase (GGDEF)-like protein